MKSKSGLRIAIIGAGIGGSSAAVALKAKGIRADVYEQAPALGEVGAGIGIRPPTVNCFKKWGLYEDIEKLTSRSDFMEIIMGDDQVFIKEAWPVLTDDKSEAYARLIHRADLLDTLIAHIPADQLHLNHCLTEMIDHGDHAEVKFANGKTIEADIVVAADGIRSPIRAQVLGQHDPVYSGYLAHRVLVSNDEVLGMSSEENILRIFVDGKNSVYLLPLEHRQQVSVDITVPGKFSWRPEMTKEEIMKSIEGFGPTIQKIIENIKLEDIVTRPLCDIEPMTTWSTKCVTLIGDAAHAMLHNQGQGANMAIQDADVLAEEIAKAETPAEALQNYEEQRKPITKLYQNLSRLFPTDEAETAFPEKAHF
ncbi:monooxygenase [Peribacillus muralis]|uniref:Monooxygenase n=1 Tax=Peribacillus muralis TaxID=264697 RepID=A0A1B3XMG5_9BACI|nr:NAD(P)/FAD-dependent oxidoreductase [Peribacillus muralis]AOH54399.1 monooxygenase [Peribacillus muralis]